jgi:predicted RNase H-like HicB family nuclease
MLQESAISYRLPLVIEKVEDGSYLATSPQLEGFLVLADTIEELLALAPGIARSLIDAMREKGLFCAS